MFIINRFIKNARSYKRIIAFLLVVAMVAVMWPGAAGKAKAGQRSEDSVHNFEDNRFVKEDGSVYIRMKDVTTTGAHVIFYKADPMEVSSRNYQPADSEIFYDGYMSFDRVEDDFFDEEIASCIDECLSLIPDENNLLADGRAKAVNFYLEPSGKVMHVRDTSEIFAGKPQVSGKYYYVPYYAHKGAGEEPTPTPTDVPGSVEDPAENPTEEPSSAPTKAPVPTNTPEPTDTQAPTQIPEPTDEPGTTKAPTPEDPPTEIQIIRVKEPDTLIRETEAFFEEEEWVHVEEVMEHMYVRLKGLAYVSGTRIGDGNKFEKYHNYDRYPTADQVLCDPNVVSDFSTVNGARKELLYNQPILQPDMKDMEILLYFDKDEGLGLAGLYLENDALTTTSVRLSTGEQTIAYKFDSIDWTEIGENTYSMVHTNTNGLVEMSGETDVQIGTNTGIANHISYHFQLGFSINGVIIADGTVTITGGGTEELTYRFGAAATEFQTTSNIDFEYGFVRSMFVKETEVIIPGREYNIYITHYADYGHIQDYQVYYAEYNSAYQEAENSPSMGNLTTRIYPVKQHQAVYNAWPDDTDPKDGSRPEGTPIPTPDPNGTWNNPSAGEDPEDGEVEENEGEDVEEGETEGGENEEEGDNPEEDIEEDTPSYEMPIDLIKYVEASSELQEASGTHEAGYLIDKDLSTAWVEGVSGTGVGESVTMYFTQEVTLTGMKIANGYFKSSDLYGKNGQIEKLLLVFEDGSSEYVTLTTDKMEEEYLEFDEAHTCNQVTFIIMEAKVGSKYSDTCVSELSLFMK